jgi:uncharacterized protein (UPF0335 family)
VSRKPSVRARQRLVHHVQSLERLDERRKEIAEDVKAALESARADGFDLTTLKVVLKLRKMSPEQRRERRALEAIYMAALGLLDGDPLPDEARRRLDGLGDQRKLDEAPPSDPPADDTAEPPADAPPPPVQEPLIVKDPAEARQEGVDAAAAGKRIYDNPYPALDPCRAAWDEGWCAQTKSHGMDTPTAYQRRTPEKDRKDDKEHGADKKGAA